MVDVSEFTDEEFMVCPSNIIVFSLKNQNWYSVDVTGLTPKIWKPEVLDRLVLDREKKDALTLIASTNSQAVQAAKSVDVIEGKGKGVVLLLHGPPGVGKTVSCCPKYIYQVPTDTIIVNCRSTLRVLSTTTT